MGKLILIDNCWEDIDNEKEGFCQLSLVLFSYGMFYF